MSDISSALSTPPSEHAVPSEAIDDPDVDMDAGTGLTTEDPVEASTSAQATPVLLPESTVSTASTAASSVALPSLTILPAGPGGFGRHRGLLLSRPSSAQSHHQQPCGAVASAGVAQQQHQVYQQVLQQPEESWQRTIRRPTTASGRPHSFHTGDGPMACVVAHPVPVHAHDVFSSAVDPTLLEGGLPTALPGPPSTACLPGGRRGAAHGTPSAFTNQAPQRQQLRAPSAAVHAVLQAEQQRPTTSPALRTRAGSAPDVGVPSFSATGASSTDGAPDPHPFPLPSPGDYPQYAMPYGAPPPGYGRPMYGLFPPGAVGGAEPYPYGAPMHHPPPPGAYPPGPAPMYAVPYPAYSHVHGQYRPPYPYSLPGAPNNAADPSSCDPLALQHSVLPPQHVRHGSDWSASSPSAHSTAAAVATVEANGNRSAFASSAAGRRRRAKAPTSSGEDEVSVEGELRHESNIMRLEYGSRSDVARVPPALSGSDDADSEDDEYPYERSNIALPPGRYGSYPFPPYGAPPGMQHAPYPGAYAGGGGQHPSIVPPHSHPQSTYYAQHGAHEPSVSPEMQVVDLPDTTAAALKPTKNFTPITLRMANAPAKKKKKKGTTRTASSSSSPSTTGLRAPQRFNKIPNPVPVPNLNKRSRGRHVPVDPAAVRARRGINAKVFHCDVEGCNKYFGRSEHLKRHTRSLHTNEKPFPCPHPNCNKAFSRHDNLNQHFRVHRGNPVDAKAMIGIDFRKYGILEPHSSSSSSA